MTSCSVNGRGADPVTGRFLDGGQPEYVSEAAKLVAQRVAYFEERDRHPPPPKEERPRRPNPGPLTAEERAYWGLPPKPR